jgi:hypothetical protein
MLLRNKINNDFLKLNVRFYMKYTMLQHMFHYMHGTHHEGIEVLFPNYNHDQGPSTFPQGIKKN